jgi:hypothetical protein
MGFAAAIGGAGAALQQLNEARRNRELQQWSTTQGQLSQMLRDAAQSATTPERQADIWKTIAGLGKLRPGQDPSKIISDIQNHLIVNPIAAQAMNPPTPPGPPGPGQVPGNTSPSGGLGPGAGAQPPTSPVSPQAQGPASPVSPVSPVSPQAQGPPPLRYEGPLPGSPDFIKRNPVENLPFSSTGDYTDQSSRLQAVSPQAVSPQAVPSSPPPPGMTSSSTQNPAMIAYYRALQMGSMPPALQTAAQPFLANEAALSHQKDMDQYLIHTLGPERLEAIKKQVQNWDQLPPYIQAGYAASAMGMPAITMPGMVMMPRLLASRVLGSEAPPGSVEYGTNKPIDPNSLYRKMEIPMTGEIMWQPEAPDTVVTQTSGGGLQSSNKYTGQTVAPFAGAVAPSSNIPIVGQLNGNAATAYGRPGGGLLPHGFLPNAQLPQTISGVGTTAQQVMDTDPNSPTFGQPIIKQFQSPHSQRVQKGISSGGGGGAASIPQEGRTLGVKPLTPEQSLTAEQQYNTLTRAIGVMQNIRNQSHILDSMLESGKLQLASNTDDGLKFIINRSMKLTPAESKFLGDFQTMAEDINLLRKPLGGAGFRSPEAWAALQGLRGNLLQNPDISRRVIDNTLNAFNALQAPLAKRVSPGGNKQAPSPVQPVGRKTLDQIFK